MNITVEFGIIELVWVQNFTLNKELWDLGPNLHKKCISGQKQKKWTPAMNSV